MWKPTIVLTLLSMVLVAGCARSGGGGPSSAPGRGPSPESWERQWEQLKTDARAEGKLVVIVTVGPETRAALAQAMKDKFGVELEFVAGPRR